MLLAARHGAGQLVFTLFQARKDAEYFFNVCSNVRLVLTNVSAHLQVLGNRHAGKHAAAFRHHGQALLHQVPRALTLDAFAQVFDVPGADGQRTGNGFHGGGLARAVGADQGDQLALAHFEVHALHGLNATVCDLEAADFE